MPALSSFRPARLAGRPGVALPKLHVPISAYVVDCAVYVDGHRLPGRWTHDRALAEVRRREEGFVWIGMHEPDEEQIKGIAEVFELHELAVEDAVHAHQRPKLERYDDMLFMVLKTVCYVGHAQPTTANEIVETGEIMVFVGPDFVITVRHGEHSSLHRVRRKLEADPEQLALGPAAVLHAIADHVVDNYLEVTEAIEDDIDEMEAEVFTPRSTMDAEQIYVMKREVLELRRAVVPLGQPGAQADRGLQRAGPARGALVLPRRRRPPGHRDRPGGRLQRTADHAGRRGAGQDDHAAERRHAQDRRVRGDRVRADHAGRDIRHELRQHARAALAVQLLRAAGS